MTLFVGAVRDHDDARGVDGPGLHRPPDRARPAPRRGAEVAAAPRGRRSPPSTGSGDLEIGDAAVVVAAAAAHRGQAFDACRALIDDLKATVPIWKHQLFADGGDEWVGTP